MKCGCGCGCSCGCGCGCGERRGQEREWGRYGRGFANGSRTHAITELQNWRAGLGRVIVGREN
jgi:hypothetical protein